MAEPHHNTHMFRPPFNPSAVLAPPAHPTLSENEPIDQFIQSGADGSSYYPGYATPSEHDYFSLFAEFAMDLTPPPSMKSQQQQQQQQAPPVLGKTGLAPTYSTTAVPPEALNANRKRKKDAGIPTSNGTGTAPTKKATQAAAAKKTKKQQQQDLVLSDEDDDLDAGEGGTIPERERRLLKNRKAAQQFRKRQKNHILELEARVETLSTENSTLTSQVELLHAENKLIREQLDYMRSFVLNALQFTFPGGGGGGGGGGMPMHELAKVMMPPSLSRSSSDSSDKDSSRP